MSLQQPFTYNPSKNLVMEFYANNFHDSTGLFQNCMGYFNTERNITNGWRSVLGHKDSAWGDADQLVFYFGFDLIPTASVHNINTGGNLQLYPNPNSGRFTVSFESKKVQKEVMLSVTNMVGQQVMQERYQNTSERFSKEIDLSSAGKGVYFVELKTDDERVVKKVVVQ